MSYDTLFANQVEDLLKHKPMVLDHRDPRSYAEVICLRHCWSQMPTLVLLYAVKIMSAPCWCTAITVTAVETCVALSCSSVLKMSITWKGVGRPGPLMIINRRL